MMIAIIMLMMITIKMAIIIIIMKAGGEGGRRHGVGGLKEVKKSISSQGQDTLHRPKAPVTHVLAPPPLPITRPPTPPQSLLHIHSPAETPPPDPPLTSHSLSPYPSLLILPHPRSVSSPISPFPSFPIHLSSLSLLLFSLFSSVCPYPFLFSIPSIHLVTSCGHRGRLRSLIP